MNLAFGSFETLSRKHVNGTIHTHIPAQVGSLNVGIGRRMDIYIAYSYVAVKLALLHWAKMSEELTYMCTCCVSRQINQISK